MSLQRALLLLVALVLLAGLVPAGILMDRRLETALVEEARSDLALAPRVLEDRLKMQGDMRMMHAMDAARAEGLAGALAAGDTARATGILRDAVSPGQEQPLLLDAAGESLLGRPPGDEVVEAAREGGVPVALAGSGAELRRVALAPVKLDGRVVGFAGVWTPVDQGEAGTLAGLTRSDVLISDGRGRLAAFTGDSVRAAGLLDAAGRMAADGTVQEVRWRGSAYLLASVPWSPARVTFVRSLDEELGVVPQLRRIGAVSLAVALLFAALVGGAFAAALGRPVRALATAASRVANRDFDAPVPDSAVTEVNQVAEAFRVMREALAARLRELEEANQELEDRQRRLKSLQSELIQRDRLVASGRLVAELAHEIRNPVANIRNCLEVIDRSVEEDAETKRFVDLAIDELLRMHELAEQMLDLNRPREPDSATSDVAEVARQAAALFRAGRSEGAWRIEVGGAAEARAAIAPDALKQVLMNLVENAREAMPDGGTIQIRVEAPSGSEDVVSVEVVDEGPGVPEENRGRIFDPFFTTKGSVRGVGLGLSVAEGIVRRYGGRISVGEGPDEKGARFRIELLPAGAGRELPGHGAPEAERSEGEPGADAGGTEARSRNRGGNP